MGKDMKYAKQEVKVAIDRLKSFDWETDSLLIVIKSVSKSGMTRRMEIYSKTDNAWLTRSVARAIGWSMNDNGIKVDGCGMDMCFHLADTLTWALYGHDRYAMSKSGKLHGNGGNCIAWKTL